MINAPENPNITINYGEFANFNYSFDLNNNAITLTWNITEGEIQPLSFLLYRNNLPLTSLGGDSRSYIDQNLELGIYTYRFDILYEDNTTLATEDYVINFNYALPEGLNYNINNFYNVHLNWNITEGEITPISYQILRNDSVIASIPENELAYIDSNLSVGNYIYKISAEFTDTTILIEDELNITIYGEYAVPTVFMHIIENQNDIFLNWGISNKDNKPVSFRIERNENIIDTIEGTEFIYTDSNVKAGSYTYRLLADYVNDTTIIADKELHITIDYAVPSDFTYSVKYENNVVLNWMNYGEGIRPSSYHITRNDDTIAILPENAVSYTDTNLEEGEYIYSLIVYYGEDTIITLPLDSIVTISYHYAVPTNLSYTIENKDVNLSWYLPFDEGILPLFYKMIRNGDTIAEFSIDSNSFIDTGLALGLYSYQLIAYYPKDTIILISFDTVIINKIYAFPGNLFINQFRNNVILSWYITENGELPVNFQINRNDSIIAVLSTENNMYIDSNLEIGNYLYKFITNYSDTIITIEDDSLIVINEIYKDPILFDYSIQDTNDVVLIWNVPEIEIIDSFLIERDSIIIATLNNDVFEYIDSNLSFNNYLYRLHILDENDSTIIAENELFVSVYQATDEVEDYIVEIIDSGATYFSPPLNFSETVQNNTVVLTWETPAGAIPLSYTIERNNTVIAELSGTTLTYSDINLEVGTYVYRICARFDSLGIYSYWGQSIAATITVSCN
ncbi:MAG: hypothetical protein WCZ21_01890 [Bacteroidales bacterium]|jgi:hypothetical protein